MTSADGKNTRPGADSADPDEPSERFKRGMGVRRLVHGHQHVDEAWRATEGDEQRRVLEVLITDCVWGTVWSRKGLPSKVRSLVTIGMLIASHQERDLRLHIRSAVLRNQCSMAEVREVVLHAAPYCGIPAATAAYEATEDVARELASLGPGTYPAKRKRSSPTK